MSEMLRKVSPLVRAFRFRAEHDQDAQAAQIESRIAAQTFFVLLAAALGSLCSAGLSFQGTVYQLERDGGAVFATIGSALAITIVVACFQLIGWACLLDVKSYRTRIGRVGAIVLTLAFLLFGYGTSSYFNYSAITAPSATTLYLAHEVGQLKEVSGGLRLHADAARQLLPKVEGERDAACNAYEEEKDAGVYSGSSGSGRVSGVLLAICSRATSEAQFIAKMVEENAERTARLERVLGELETMLNDSDTPILERERAMRAKIRELDGLIRDYRSAKVADSVDAFFKGLVASVAALGSNTASGYQGRANLALAELRQGFVERAGVIETLKEKLVSERVPEIDFDPRPSVHKIMRYSAGEHPQNLLLAMGIDSFAAFMILVLLCKGEPKRKPDGRLTQINRDIPASLLRQPKAPSKSEA